MRRHAAALVAVLLAVLAPAAHAGEGDRPADRDRQLQDAIEQIVAHTPLGAARTSIVVSRLDTGEVLYARDPDALLNPASNVKLFTSAAVLARLGPEYRFETEVWSEAHPSGGRLKSLVVRGKGDPTVVTERLWVLAGDIAHRGVEVVSGDLVVDDGYFDGERQGPGYDQERGDRTYLAPVGALSLNFNTVTVLVSAGGRAGDRARVEIEPASEYLQIENRARTVKASARRRIAVASILLPNGKQRIVVEGRVPAGSRDLEFHRKIDDPPAYFGWTLKRLLELRGVKVKGQVRRGTVPSGARLLATSESESLGEIVRRLEKRSNNFMAEQLLKTLGAEKKGAPGTWAKGVEAVEDFLAEAGIPRGSYVMKNGSGLNDTNRFSARQTVALLREMWRRFPLMPDFVAALPVAGKDGTTRWRMESTEGRMRAKTGTLESAICLSGYVETAARDQVAFSILVNDFPGRTHLTVRAVDAIGTALAAAGKPSALGAAVASAGPPPTRIDAVDEDVRAHLATYYRLGRSGEPRNVEFLRTSLKTETDPVLRLAAAEAVYLSEPDSQSARRAFLDAVANDEASFPRLRSLGGDLGAPSPVLGSLGDLAAEGRTDALARLVDLSPVAMDDPGLVEGMAELWEDVARAAPDATVVALRTARPAASSAALSAIARGLARDGDDDHPFLAAVRTARADPDLGPFARALEGRLAEQITAARAAIQAGAPTLGPPTSSSPAQAGRKDG